MRIAFLSDIHGNLEALEAAFEAIGREKVDQVVCLGDIVGYGADPDGCVNRIRERANHAVLGNHDAAVIGTTSIERFNAHARAAVHWTRRHLSDENAEWLRALPLKFHGEEFLAVHASPFQAASWIYVVDQELAEEAFHAFEEPVCFLGHSHVPAVFREGDGGPVEIVDGAVTLPEGGRFIINVGSVGQPRDRDPRFSFGIYDNATLELRIVRGDYDRETASRKILDAGLPEMLAKRIHLGI
ncbi:MAG: metallophosphoesterase family protein [Candidatus Eisenbacteria bacterium]|nr:metallophosphoesterase family protein [Candidatus Eisenbacteria bacterium]